MAHVDRIVCHIVRQRDKVADGIINVVFQVREGGRGVGPADEASLLAVQLRVPLGEEIELAVPLPDGIPVRLCILCADCYQGALERSRRMHQ